MSEPSWYELEYSPRLRVPDAALYFQRWAQEAQQARQSLAYQTLQYGPSPQETLDLFPAPHGRAMLVFFHGGYWRAFDKDDFSWIAPPLVQAGFSVALVNYALCPSASLAEITEQCRRAVAWLYRAYPLPLIISGHSAGGHLTGEVFATPWANYDLPSEAIVGGISISGLFDLQPLIHVSFNADLQLDTARAKAASPAFKQATIAAPLVLAVGALESDEFHRQSHLLKEAWPQTCTEVIVLPNCHHFNALDALANPSSLLWEHLLKRVRL